MSTSYDFEYTGAVQQVILPPGRYKIECWGAAGGTVNASYPGGKGGYSTGILTLAGQTTLYIYVGQEGQKEKTFNIGHTKVYSNTKCKNGGGATDVRIGVDSLYARVIVAGAGGGASYYSGQSYGLGGVGGGASGGDGTSREDEPDAYGRGGTQIAGGANGTRTNILMTLASFGGGGFPQASGYSDASGGGGWFGGGCGGRAKKDYCEAGGGGGSGYVWTAETAYATASGIIGGNWLLTPAHYLTDAATIRGDQLFPAPNGGTETGHSGHGFVRITRTGVRITDVVITPNPVETGKQFIVSAGVIEL